MRTPLAALLAVVALVAACDTGPKVNPNRVARTITSADGDIGVVVDGNSAMNWDVYREVAAADDGNLFLSPFSMSAALGMTWAGAATTTNTEMGAVLHADLPDADWHTAFGALIQDLSGDKDRGYTLRIANRLFGQTGSPWKADFLATCSDAYGAPLEDVDFMADPDGVRTHINGWVADQTADRIPDLLPPGSISPATALVLANAIYFLADWALPFDPDDTTTGTFTRADGSTVQTPLMHQDTGDWEDGLVDFASGGGVSVLRLPYADHEVSMVLVVPDEVDGLAAVEASLTPAVFDGWMRALYPQEVFVTMPKVEIRWEQALSGLLSELGMPSAFTGDADLTGMAEDPFGSSLYVSEVYHQAFVKIDEEGTEAAAATAVVVDVTSAGAQLDATHPFLFVIRDDLTGSILFVGRVADPTAG